jgi:hypothetical protein
MTEAEWLACTEPQRMLQFLGATGRDRKLRFFSLACYERVAKHVRDPRSRAAAAFAARLAEAGVARRRGLPAVRERASQAWKDAYDSIGRSRNGRGYSKAVAECWAADVARYTVHADAEFAARTCSVAACTAAGYASGPARRRVGVPESYELAHEMESAGLADLLRCIFGNPFRPVTVSPAWREPQVLALAQAAYDQRELPAGTLEATRLAVLADALEEAGCTDQSIITHLRGPRPHVRGCWAVDLLLGKS